MTFTSNPRFYLDAFIVIITVPYLWFNRYKLSDNNISISGIKQSSIVITISLILLILVAIKLQNNTNQHMIEFTTDNLLYKNNDGIVIRYARSFGYIGLISGIFTFALFLLGMDKPKKQTTKA
jgi:hypothetical protein